MAYCRKCGHMLDGDSSFCSNCGAKVERVETPRAESSSSKEANAVTSDKIAPQTIDASDKSKMQGVDTKSSQGNQNDPSGLFQERRKEIYEGVIHKCPNCGAVIDAYNTTCKSCGFEIRSENALSSVQELSRKLENIESQRNLSKKKSFLSNLYGLSTDPVYSAKATAIMNYPIPNTKEEILEFMVLASSNVNSDAVAGVGDAAQYYQYRDSLVEQNAWLSKMEQAYKKAQLNFPTDPTFALVKQIYEQKNSEINSKKKKKTLLYVAIILVLILLIVLCIWGVSRSVDSEKNKKSKEIERLEAVVSEMEEDIAYGDYSAAKRKAQRLHYNGPDDTNRTNEKSWDDTREGYIAEIEKLEGKEAE